jgi:hypothetical protein
MGMPCQHIKPGMLWKSKAEAVSDGQRRPVAQCQGTV